jgi:hypothetical protein
MSWDLARAGSGSARDWARRTKEQRTPLEPWKDGQLFREPRPTTRVWRPFAYRRFRQFAVSPIRRFPLSSRSPGL